MNLKTFNALDMANGLPAEAGTPNLPLHGVPPSGGGARENTMTLKVVNALDTAIAPPAKAGTPYGAEIQQGMKELEGMLK